MTTPIQVIQKVNEAQSTEREKNQRINRLIKALSDGIPIATGISGLAAGIATFLATPSSANLATALTDESGTAGTLPFQSTGTWTPAVAFGGGTTGITYGTQTGAYTRIGNVCFLQCRITLTSKGSSTGTATVTGSPFTPIQDSGYIGGVSWGNMSSISGNVFCQTGNTGAFSVRCGSAGGTTSATLVDTNFTNTSDLFFAGFFRI
jgi:hypothetical protein